jgi:hypothetical protein
MCVILHEVSPYKNSSSYSIKRFAHLRGNKMNSFA